MPPCCTPLFVTSSPPHCASISGICFVDTTSTTSSTSGISGAALKIGALSNEDSLKRQDWKMPFLPGTCGQLGSCHCSDLPNDRTILYQCALHGHPLQASH